MLIRLWLISVEDGLMCMHFVGYMMLELIVLVNTYHTDNDGCVLKGLRLIRVIWVTVDVDNTGYSQLHGTSVKGRFGRDFIGGQ